MTRLEIAARIAAGLAAHPHFILSLIPNTSLEIADELIRLEAETRPKPEQELPFEMVVGGVYEMRNGEIEEIILNNGRQFCPFIAKSGRAYPQDGGFCGVGKSPYDLIKRIR